MSLFLIILYIAIVAVLVIAAFIIVGGFRSRGALARALNMSLFLVTLPRETQDPNRQQKPDKELISVMEQLYASFGSIHAKGWNKFLYGEPYVSLEISVHHVGEEIHFYVAVPRTYEQIFEKQVHGLYPQADVQKVQDYNIFNPGGVTAGAYLKMKANPILPFRTYVRLESDPLGELVTSLSKLQKEGEGASIQLLIRPSHREDIRKLAQKVAREMQSGNDFKRALQLAKGGNKKKKDKDETNVAEPPKVVTAFEEEIIKALQAKASRVLFDANIRVLVSAENEERAKQLLNDAVSAFVQFSGPDMNSFDPSKVSGRALDKLVFDFSFRLFNDHQTVNLSSEEVASIYHFPLATTQAPKIKFLKTKFAEPPTNLPETGVIIGKSKYRGQEKPIRLSDNDRRRHLYIIGQTGTGKSSIMKNMLVQDMAAGRGVAVIDPHGEFAEYVLSVVPKERAQDVIYFNPGDTEHPMGLNLFEFDPAKPEQKTLLSNEFFSIMKTIYKELPEAFGPMFEQYYKNSALLLMDVFERKFRENGNSIKGIEHEIPTMAEIPRVFIDENYRREKLALETNPLVKNFWEQEAEKAGGDAALANMAPYINSKLSPFLTNDFVRPIVGQHQSAFDFRQVMDQQKILVVNLSKGRIGEINANLLGMLVVSKLSISALSRVDIADESQRKDFFLYIDEFQNFTTPSIATILSEARKYRLDLIVAHQYIKQLQENIRDAIFGNIGSMILFRVGPDDAEFLKNKFEPVFSAQDLMSIDNFNAHINMLVNNQTTKPFNIQTVRESDGSPEMLSLLKDMSRRAYGHPREEVENEIKDRYKIANSNS